MQWLARTPNFNFVKYRRVAMGLSSLLSLLALVRTSVLLGFVPRWLRPELSSAAVIGFGIGGTARLLSHGVPTTTIELEPGRTVVHREQRRCGETHGEAVA